MLTRLRERLGTAGFIIAVVALIAAIAGGAIAATGSGPLTASNVKKSKKGQKGPRGPKGDTGPQGPTGPTGETGATGANGKDGTGPAGATGATGDAGAEGQSVVSTELDPGEGGCVAGGVEFETANGASVVCNGEQGVDGVIGEDGEDGEEGSPWTVGGVLPEGETLTGMWGISAAVDDGSDLFGSGVKASTVVSFPLPLTAAPTPHFIDTILSSPVPGQCEDGTHPGSAGRENPEADPGHLCVYGGVINGGISETFPIKFVDPSDPIAVIFGGAAETTPFGTMLYIEQDTEALGGGTWAVTAPTS